MSQYSIVEESRSRGLEFVVRIHRMRMLGTALCTLPIASVLLERAAPMWLWVLLFLNAVLWPQVALQLGRRARDPVTAEFRSLMLDSAFGGAWIAAMAVSAAPSAVFVTLLTADKIASGGWRLLWRTTLSLVAGFALAWAALDFGFAPVSSQRTLLACIPFLFLYTVGLSSVTHRLKGQVVEKNKELHRLARMDPVMQVPNRPHFESAAAVELARFLRSGRPASLLLIDIDQFKLINDRHGHGMGDIVLKRVAALLKEAVREVDLPARYGGDEFAVLLVDTDTTRAQAVAERIRQQLMQQAFDNAPGLACTLSIGVAEATRGYHTLDAWVQAADAALYSAKAAGRNRIEVGPHDTGTTRRLRLGIRAA